MLTDPQSTALNCAYSPFNWTSTDTFFATPSACLPAESGMFGQVRADRLSAPTPTTVGELALVYLVWCQERRYSQGEIANRRSAINELRCQFGTLSLAAFGAPQLLQLQEHFVRLGWSRNYCNRQIRRVIQLFAWGVPYRFVTVHLVQELRLVPPLKAGHTAARETKPRSAPSQAEIAAVRSCLPEKYQPLFDLLRLTGARPGELLQLTTGMIERCPPPEPWRCVLRKHKTSHWGRQRVLYFNDKAQTILRALLSANPDAPLFRFSHDAFCEAVRQACHTALGLPAELHKDPRYLTPQQRRQRAEWRQEHAWTPYALRHKVATELVDQLSLEAAQHVLGHSDAAMTAEYARTAERQAKEAIKRLG